MTDAEPTAPPPASLPVTGHPGIDAALAGLELGSDVHRHPEEIALALEAVAAALNPGRQPPLPGR